jgi:hypothetical protein
MRAWLVLLLPLIARAEGVTIERATVPWSELERLLRKEGATPPPRSAPRAWSLPSMEVSGEVISDGGGRVDLHLAVEVEVLADRWTVAPLLPAALAVSSASVTFPAGRRGLLVRDSSGVALAADGPGRYHLEIQAEGGLEHGRLVLTPAGLAGGRASLTIHGAESATAIGGRTPWRTHSDGSGALVAEAALGSYGVDLTLGHVAPTAEAGSSIEDLDAVTVLSLGGSGVTRLLFSAGADESGILALELPQGARLWRVYVAGTALAVATVTRGSSVRLPLNKASKIELAFTFEAPPMGIRGRYHLELPRLPVPVRGAHWELHLPAGLQYAAPQAAMSPAHCGAVPAIRPRTPITPVGTCLGFERSVLEPGRAYVEGKYDQPL